MIEESNYNTESLDAAKVCTRRSEAGRQRPHSMGCRIMCNVSVTRAFHLKIALPVIAKTTCYLTIIDLVCCRYLAYNFTVD